MGVNRSDRKQSEEQRRPKDDPCLSSLSQHTYGNIMQTASEETSAYVSPSLSSIPSGRPTFFAAINSGDGALRSTEQ